MWRADADLRLAPLLDLPGVAEPFNMPRQALPGVVAHRATRRDPHRYTAGRIDDGGHIEGVVVPPASAVDIDHLIDFQMAELVFDAEMPQPLIAHLAQRSA
jgi:hypothetical protein